MAVNKVHETLEFSIGHTPHFVDACALSPVKEEEYSDVMDVIPNDIYLDNIAAFGIIAQNKIYNNIDNAIFGTGKFYKEKQEEKKENIYENIDEMLSGTLNSKEDK